MAEAEVGAVAAHFAQWLPQLREVARGGLVLDLASGRGRHAFAASQAGLRLIALDRNLESLRELAAGSVRAGQPVACLRADLEGEFLPPFPPNAFAAILVYRYLHRSLAPWIERALMPGGLLLYETFTSHQRSLGWGPRRAEFLLEPGELPTLFPHLEVECYVEGLSEDAQPAQTARLVARRAEATGA